MIEIDGSYGESGGQIIRTSLTLSALTKKEVSIENIRAGRPNPGLAAQHLTAVKAVRNVCRGTLDGAEIGSKSLVFHPGEIVGGKYEFNIGTAGSVTLVAQTIIPILLHANKPSSIRIIGGTHVIKSPGYDYFERVFIPAIRYLGAEVESKLVRPGFYPKGGGIIDINLKPSKLFGKTEWPLGEPIKVLIRLADLPQSISMKEKKVFLENEINDVRVYEDKDCGPGNAVTASTNFRGAYVAGEKGKPAHDVAKEALNEILKEQFDVDKHLADQLLVYAVLAEGKTEYITSEITEHTRTNAEIIKKFVDRKIEIEGNTIRIG
jgi:RNA 3'-terminal phosphate cyclase (ATP)